MTDGLSDDRRRELNDYLFPRPAPPLRDRLRRRKQEDVVPDLITYDDAVTWARTHQVGIPSNSSTRQRVDLRLSASSLPVLAELLGSTDMTLFMTSSLALQFNGARIDSDATDATDPTFNRVTFPDGSELTVTLNLG
jgi:hypothetical protein